MPAKSDLKYIGALAAGQPTVLFIPGGLTSPVVYDGFDREIAWQSAQVDWSLSPGPWDVVELGKRLLLLIDELSLGPVALVGYSAGGVIALAAAMEDAGRRIAGMLLSNTGPCAVGHGDPKMPQKILDNWGDPQLIETFINRCFSKPVPGALREKLLAYAARMDKLAAYETTLSLRQHDLRPRLGDILCPVVIAHGTRDSARTLDHVRQMTEGIRDTEVFLLDGGHTIMLEDRENWLSALRHLLEKIA